MSQLTEMVRSAPAAVRGPRPMTTWRQDLITMVLAIWPITAMYFDGLNHNNKTGQESFFSIEHTALYTGMAVFAGWVIVLVTNEHVAAARANGRSRLLDLTAIPVGYGVTIIGLLMLGLGGPWDLVWHEIYGFEVGVDAIYSPSHLALFFGGLLVATTGIRSMWAKHDITPDFTRFLPVLLSSILVIGVASFITMYLSAFMTNVSMTSDFTADLARFRDPFDDQTISLNAGLTGYGDDLWPYYYYSAGHGVAALIITTLVLLGPILLVLRRWRVPFGAVTVIFGGVGLLVSLLAQYRDIVLIIPLLLAGASVDLLQRRLGGTRADGRVTLGAIRIIGTAAATVLWGSYFIVVALHRGIGWEPTLWVGALLVGIMTGFGVAFLIAPPAYGPRLVEAEE